MVHPSVLKLADNVSFRNDRIRAGTLRLNQKRSMVIEGASIGKKRLMTACILRQETVAERNAYSPLEDVVNLATS